MVPEHPIRVVSRRTGLSPHVIRIWEKRYRAVVPRRSQTKRRFYTDEDIERLILLRRVTLTGRGIGQVASLNKEELLSLLRTDSPSRSTPLSRLPENTDDPVEQFVEACLKAVEGLDTTELEKALSHASAGLSQPVFLEQFLVRLMSRIGDCWREGSMRVMHEHLISSVLRSFLGTMSVGFQYDVYAPLLVATTPAGQLHEMGALAAAVTAASEGWRVLYLGPNLPAEEIGGAAQGQKARSVALSILYPSDDPRLGAELVRLRRAIGPEVELIIGGRAAGGYTQTLQEVQANLMDDLSTFRHRLESLRRNPRT